MSEKRHERREHARIEQVSTIWDLGRVVRDSEVKIAYVENPLSAEEQFYIGEAVRHLGIRLRLNFRSKIFKFVDETLDEFFAGLEKYVEQKFGSKPRQCELILLGLQAIKRDIKRLEESFPGKRISSFSPRYAAPPFWDRPPQNTHADFNPEEPNQVFEKDLRVVRTFLENSTEYVRAFAGDRPEWVKPAKGSTTVHKVPSIYQHRAPGTKRGTQRFALVVEMVSVAPTEEQQQRKYFSRFAARHFSQMKILQKGGILGKGSEGWRNISEHCLTTAVGGDVLGEALGLNAEERAELAQALLLQDWYKRHEILARKELGGGAAFEKTSVEDAALLREFGVPESTIELAGSNIPERDDVEYFTSRSTAQKIAHYMDMITSQSTFMPYHERIKPVLARQGDVEFLDHFKTRFNGRNLHEVQTDVVALEEAEFAERLGISTEEIIPFIYRAFEGRLANT